MQILKLPLGKNRVNIKDREIEDGLSYKTYNTPRKRLAYFTT